MNKKIISFLVVTLMISICFSSLNVFASKIKVDKSGNLGSNDFFSLNTDFEEDNQIWSHDTGGSVSCVSMSSNGEYIITGGSNGICFCQRESSTPLWFNQNIGLINSVAISSDGEYIAAGGNNGIYFFQNDNNYPVWSYNTDGIIDSVEISSDGEYISAAGYDGLYFFDKDSNNPSWLYGLDNNPPVTPLSPDGPSSITTDDTCTFEADTTDPNNDQISYMFDWGDGTYSDWTDYKNSGETANASHRWSSTGNYEIRVKAKDDKGMESEWSSPADLSVPKNKIKTKNFYNLLISLRDKFFNFLKEINKGYKTDITTDIIDNKDLYDSSTNDIFMHSVEMSSDGEYIAVVLKNKVYFFDKNSNTPRWTYDVGYNIRELTITGDANYIAAHQSGKLDLLSRTGDHLAFTAAPGTNNNPCDFSTDEKYLVCCNYKVMFLYYINENNHFRYKWNVPFNSPSQLNCVTISSDGSSIIAGTVDGIIYHFTIDSSTPVWTYDTNSKLNSVSISSNGEYFAAGCSNGNASSYFNYDDTDDILMDDDTDPEIIVNKIPSVYAIVHDPNGDSSYSKIKEFTSNEIGYSASLSVGRNVYTEVSGSLFGQGAEYSEDATMTVTGENSMSVSYTITQSVTSQLSQNKEKIGPGHGDVYWIEEWDIPYQIWKKQYFYKNNVITEKPIFRFGIIRSHSMLRSANWIEINGPSEWGADWTQRLLDLNIGYDNVLDGEEQKWTRYVGNMDFETGGPYTYDKSITAHTTATVSFDLLISESTAIDLDFLYEDVGVSGKVAITMNYDFGASMTASHSSGKSIGFELYDSSSSDPSDGSDEISVDFYEDKIFGTYLFITDEDNSYTSNPHEYWTQESG